MSNQRKVFLQSFMRHHNIPQRRRCKQDQEWVRKSIQCENFRRTCLYKNWIARNEDLTKRAEMGAWQA